MEQLRGEDVTEITEDGPVLKKATRENASAVKYPDVESESDQDSEEYVPAKEDVSGIKAEGYDEDSEEYYSANDDDDDAVADDVALGKRCKCDKRQIETESSGEFVPNPPENQNLQIQDNNQRQKNSSKEKVHKSTQTPQAYQTLYILIWLQQLSKGQVGHVALNAPDFVIYISWFPGNIIKKIFKKRPGEAKASYKEDEEFEGRCPDHVYSFDTLNMDAVMEFWQKNKNQSYHFLFNNCVTMVYKALREAGAPEYIPTRAVSSLVLYCFEIWTPAEFNKYCRKEFNEVVKD